MTDGAPPIGSKVLVERHGSDVTITVPPVGVWRPGGTANFLFVSLMGLLLSTVFTVGFAACWLADVKGAREMWQVFFILPIFWLASGGFLLWTINVGRRRAALAVVGDSLMVIQTGLFGSKKREWNRDQLEDVRTGPSSMVIPDAHGYVMELQIHAWEGLKFGLLAGHAEADLTWMASELCRALRLDIKRSVQSPAVSGTANIG